MNEFSTPTGRLYVLWRARLTSHLHESYFSHFTTLYHINRNKHHNIDNVDQRITQDVERLCGLLRDHIPAIIMSPITIVYYSWQCFTSTGKNFQCQYIHIFQWININISDYWTCINDRTYRHSLQITIYELHMLYAYRKGTLRHIKGPREGSSLSRSLARTDLNGRIQKTLF